MYISNHSMSREQRDVARQKAREQREILANQSSSLATPDSESNRGMFEVKKLSNKSNTHFEKILGKYEELNHEKINNYIGVVLQPQTPIAPREPTHDPDDCPPPLNSNMPGQGSRSSSHRSLPPPHSSRNGSSRAKPISLSHSSKLLQPSSHSSQHSQTRNGEVKGTLKSGPSSGPGEGGGKIRSANLPPLNTSRNGDMSTGGIVDDPLLQKIRSEMSLVKNPVSAILPTPRPEHHDGNTFNFGSSSLSSNEASKHSSSSYKGDSSRHKFNKPPDTNSSFQNSRALEGSTVKGDLSLSEESEDETGLGNGVAQPPQSPVGLSKLSPISGGKTSEDSSSEDDTNEDSESSSNNSTEDEQPKSEPSSPKASEGDNPWNLDFYIRSTTKKKSPSSQETATPVPANSQNECDTSTEKNTGQPPKKRDRRASKSNSTTTSHRGSRHHDSDDSSDEGESHSRPTPRPYPQLRLQKTRQSKTKSGRRVSSNHPLDSDSDSDSYKPAKIDTNQSTVTSNSSSKESSKLQDKIKTSDSIVSKETTRRTPKKRDTKKDNQIGAKSETGKSKKVVKSQQFISQEFDSDSDGSIDVVNTTPVKAVVPPHRHTPPSRTPKDSVESISTSAAKSHLSPRISPMTAHSVSSKSSSKRTPVSELQSSESLSGNSKSEELFGVNQTNSEKLETVVKDKTPSITPANFVDRESSKKGRERDPVERGSRKSKTHREDKRSGRSVNSENKDRSKSEKIKGVSESNPLDNRLSGRPTASPIVDKLQSESPIVSPEPKVPITPIHQDNGFQKLTCTIPLSLIDKVPKSSVNSVSTVIKSEVNDIDKKEVLDNRTTGKGGKGGKGKRKTGEPISKEMCNEDKKFILSNIFHGKVKKEPKTEPVNSEDSDGEKSERKPLDHIKVKDEVDESRPITSKNDGSSVSSPAASVSEAAVSTKQEKRKKKDSHQERSPSREKKKSRGNSEGRDQDFTTVHSAVENSHEGCDGISRLQPTGGESDHSSVSRKRDRERESSLESTRSSNRSESGRRSKKSKIKDSKISDTKSPNVRKTNDSSGSLAWAKSPNTRKNAGGGGGGGMSLNWDSEKDVPSHPQKPQSSQVKPDDSHATPKAENGFSHSRPASEHESRVGGSSCRSTSDQQQIGDPPSLPAVDHLENDAMINCWRSNAAETKLFDAPCRYAQRVYSSYFEKKVAEFNDTDHTNFMNMAKNLKHLADSEKDRTMQAMKYLEASLYFILSGKAMENNREMERYAFLRIYKDTLNFIKYVASVFRSIKQEGNVGIVNNKLAVISLRCQSLLSLKIYKVHRSEHKDVQRQLNNYFHSSSSQNYKQSTVETANGSGNGWTSQRAAGSPSHLSQTPSPAGSVGSEGSQSSGYTTSNEGTRSAKASSGSMSAPVGHTPPHPHPPGAAPGTISVPHSIHKLIILQNTICGHLATAHDLWMEADNYVYTYGMEDFFIDLDRTWGPLTLHSSLIELVYYVQHALHQLKG